MNKWNDKFLEKVINSYGQVLTKRNSMVGLETDLPYSKDLIRRAIALVLLTGELSDKERDDLEGGYLELESYIPAQEYEVYKNFETSLFNAEQIVKSGEEEDIKKAILTVANSPGDRASEILGNINRRKKQRINEILALISILGLPDKEEP